LLGLTGADRNGLPQSVWQSYCLEASTPTAEGERPNHPHHLYREELLTNVLDFIFNRERPHEAGSERRRQAVSCSYLRLTDKFVSRWFNKLEVTMPGRASMPLKLEPPAQVELFLSSFTVLGFFHSRFLPRLLTSIAQRRSRSTIDYHNCGGPLRPSYRLPTLRIEPRL
jgi:hypothetical protein